MGAVLEDGCAGCAGAVGTAPWVPSLWFAAWVLGTALGVLLAEAAVLAAGDDAASAACERSLPWAHPRSNGAARTAAVRVLVFVERISITSRLRRSL